MQDAGPTQHTRNTSKRIGSRVHQRANQGTDSEHDRDVNPAGAKNKRFTDPALGGLLPQNPKYELLRLLSLAGQEGPDDGASARPQPLSFTCSRNRPAGQLLLVVGLRCPTHQLLLQRRCLMGQMLVVNDAVQRAARSAMRHSEHKWAAAQCWLSSLLCGCADLSAAPLIFLLLGLHCYIWLRPSPRNADRASARA